MTFLIIWGFVLLLAAVVLLVFWLFIVLSDIHWTLGVLVLTAYVAAIVYWVGTW